MSSNLNNVFHQISEDLHRNKKVLFVGTPCQCGGLLSYVRNNKNLICIDFICHGIPSRSVWEAWQKNYEKEDIKLAAVNMRDKNFGWKRYSWKLTDELGNIKREDGHRNLYMKGFLTDIYLRPSCYECKFEGVNRLTDITLGDFWGIQDIHPELDDDKGISLLIIQSQKGLDLFHKIKYQLVYKDTVLEQAIQQNRSIKESVCITWKRIEFFRRMKEGENFEAIISSLTKATFRIKLKKEIKIMLKKIERMFRGGGNLYL